MGRTAFLLLLLGTVAAPADVCAREESLADPRARTVPTGWSEIRKVEHTPQVVAQVAAKIGIEFESLTERHLSINGFPMKLNILQAKDAKAAAAIHAKMAGIRGGAWFRRQDNLVVETATDVVLAARRVWAWLALTAGDQQRFEFRARIGLVAKHDYMEANRVFNHFLAIERGVGTEAATEAIGKLIADWKPGTRVELLSAKRPWFEARYSFKQRHAAGPVGSLTRSFDIEAPGKQLGLAYADLEAAVMVRSRWNPAEIEGDAGSTAPTKWWPADDKSTKDLATRLTKNAKTDRQRVLALLRFAALDVRTGGPMGSRHGAKKVIAQRFGHCWDKSDVLITMCRAIGIPARQIAGWVPIIKSGHVWAEVRLRDEGWITVDATTTWLGTSQDYIPLYATDDGAMPIVYLTMPMINQPR